MTDLAKCNYVTGENCYTQGADSQDLENLQGMAIDDLNHGTGAFLDFRGINTLGVVNTQAGSNNSSDDDSG